MNTEMRGRYMVGVYEPMVAGESPKEAARRRARNLLGRRSAAEWNGTRCARCGHVRAHVSHATDPASEPEGAAYYEGMSFCEFAEVTR